MIFKTFSQRIGEKIVVSDSKQSQIMQNFDLSGPVLSSTAEE
jgi:hypothetical protein